MVGKESFTPLPPETIVSGILDIQLQEQLNDTFRNITHPEHEDIEESKLMLENIQEIADQHPTDKEAKNSAMNLLKVVVANTENKWDDRAFAIYTKVLRRFPNSFHAQYGIGVVFHSQENVRSLVYIGAPVYFIIKIDVIHKFLFSEHVF